MRIAYVIVVICAIMQLSSCSSYYNDFNPYRGLRVDHLKKDPDPTLAVEDQFIKDMQMRGFSYFLHNRNACHNSVYQLGYWFDTDNRGFVCIRDARVFIVELCEDLLKRFNENAKIRPYLSKYPFNTKDLILIISFVTSKQSPSSEIGAILVGEGKVTYRWINHDNTCTDYEESYEEAKRLYDAEQKKV